MDNAIGINASAIPSVASGADDKQVTDKIAMDMAQGFANRLIGEFQTRMDEAKQQIEESA